MASGVATDPSVVMADSQHSLEWLNLSTPTEIICDFSTFSTVPAKHAEYIFNLIPERSGTLWWDRCYLQGPQFRHVVEAGDRDAADVVIV